MKSDLFIKNFYDKGFVVAKKFFQKKKIQSIFSQINSIKKKSIKVKNPNMTSLQTINLTPFMTSINT